MIFEIEGLFINTENIVTLKYAEKSLDLNTQCLFVINGIPHVIMVTENNSYEAISECRQKAERLLATIINSMVTSPVQKVRLEDKTENEK